MSKNSVLALRVLAIAVGMLCLAYAAFPLYNLFCKITGYGGTPKQTTEQSEKIGTRTVEVRFNADIDAGLPWEFKPVQAKINVTTGETHVIYYEAENKSDRPITGMAVFNVTPDKAGQYFNKMQCFCFNEQTLQPHEKVKMPVSFFIDPKIEDDKNMRDITSVTLSYTFFEAKK
jgi:cytochrome c oxidase assembly protein subunit 11